MPKRRPREQATGPDPVQHLEVPAETRRYGAEAEIDRLMRCPNCGSDRVRVAREATRGYGVFGLKAISDMTTPKPVHCRSCGHDWLRPPMRELRQEAQRRIDERYAALDGENERLRQQLADYVAYQRDIDLMLVEPPTEPDFGPDAGVPVRRPPDN